jgi:DNA mismatch repair protein MutS2
VIYPENFESKIGFDRIRQLLAENCLSPMGLDLVETTGFHTDRASIEFNINVTYEFQQLLKFEDYFPSEHYYKVADCLNKIRIAGSFPEVQEVFDLKRSLETVRAIISFFKKKDDNSYPFLKSICGNIKVYPYVLDSLDRIIDKTGNIKIMLLRS